MKELHILFSLKTHVVRHNTLPSWDDVGVCSTHLVR